MNFIESPKLFIDQYYREKINEIDIHCETAISVEKERGQKVALHLIREELIKKIRSVKQAVLDRL